MCISAVWGGAKLADVLELVGIPYLASITQSGGKHVEFVSIDKCKVIMYDILFLDKKNVVSFFSFLLYFSLLDMYTLL